MIGRINNATGNEVLVTQAYSNVHDLTSTGSNVGGLIGQVSTLGVEGMASQTNITNTYSWGIVSADDADSVGGLIGSLVSTGDYTSKTTVSNSYTGNTVTGHHLEMTNNYYNAQSADTTSCDAAGTLTTGCTAINADGEQSSYFVNNSTNAPLNTWDFETIWQANAGMPPTFRDFGVTPENGSGDNGDGDGDNSGNDGGDSTPADTDGISDAVENAAPNNGDGNNDGIKDALQSNVASYVNPLTHAYTTLAVNDDCSILSVGSQSESTEVKDGAYAYPAGLALTVNVPGVPDTGIMPTDTSETTGVSAVIATIVLTLLASGSLIFLARRKLRKSSL